MIYSRVTFLWCHWALGVGRWLHIYARWVLGGVGRLMGAGLRMLGAGR